MRWRLTYPSLSWCFDRMEANVVLCVEEVQVWDIWGCPARLHCLQVFDRWQWGDLQGLGHATNTSLSKSFSLRFQKVSCLAYSRICPI